MQRKSIIVTAALALGLALGIVVGPSVRGSVASAQTVPSTQAQTTPANGLWGAFLDKLATTLNISRSTLDGAIATAGNSTADEAVTAGTLTQEQADKLKARIAAGDIGALAGGRGGPGGPGGRGGLGGVETAITDAAASTLGITSDELRTQLRSGQTLAQLAQAHNTTEQAVIDAALAAAKTQLDSKVTAGTLTQAQADTIYSQLQARGSALLSGRGHGPGGKRDGTQPPATPAAPSATSTAAGI